MAFQLPTLTRAKYLLSSIPSSYRATRSFTLNITRMDNYPNCFSDKVESYRDMEHPFLRRGSKMPVEKEQSFDAIHMRVDMPGVAKEGLKLWIERNVLYFEGHEGEKDPSIDKEKVRRKYCGRICVDMGSVHVDQIKAQMKNGVLKVVIPKVHADF